MKAIVLTEYGSPQVLQLRELPKPAPKPNELLIRVRATTVNYGDLLARNFKAVTSQEFNMPWLFWFFAKLFFGFTKSKITILGSEFSGEVEASGNNVASFQRGDIHNSPFTIVNGDEQVVIYNSPFTIDN